ncbi:DinB family protein [Deinococcus cellulosilyticus]|nr:DinB family protein [Deinococcus cellulosilyticus]
MTELDRFFIIQEQDGYTPKIGLLVSMLQNSRHYLLRAVRDLSQAELDARPLGAVNTIASLLAHLNAAETMFQRMTFEGRRFAPDEIQLQTDFRLENSDQTRNQPLEVYLQALAETRTRTLQGMKAREDAWLETETTFFGQPANWHYYWFHYLQDEVRHTGQITLIRKHLIPEAQKDFNPYSMT